MEDLGPEADDEGGARQDDGVVRAQEADGPLVTQRLDEIYKAPFIFWKNKVKY